eukprot:2430544-Rhodomonas_salina.2
MSGSSHRGANAWDDAIPVLRRIGPASRTVSRCHLHPSHTSAPGITSRGLTALQGSCRRRMTVSRISHRLGLSLPGNVSRCAHDALSSRAALSLDKHPRGQPITLQT